MPIIELQRRLREIGRLRIGERVPATKRDGTPTTRPKKLTTFRFTSRDEQVIRAATELFGGEVKPWEDAPGQAQWQVTTEASELEVMIPPGEMAFSQWYELWSAGGCKRRCDGATDVIGDRACVCDPKNRECDPHTRLSVIVPTLPGLGLWRLDTQGWNAANELAGAVDLCSAATARGLILPARLRLEIREEKKPGRDGKPQTRKFAVPVLDVDVAASTLHGLSAGANPTTGELPSFGKVPELPPGPQPTIAEQLEQIGEEGPGRRSNAAEPIRPTGLPPGGRKRELVERLSALGLPTHGNVDALEARLAEVPDESASDSKGGVDTAVPPERAGGAVEDSDPSRSSSTPAAPQPGTSDALAARVDEEPF